MQRRYLFIWFVQQEKVTASIEQLGQWCKRYSPITSIVLPDGICVDIMGCAHLFGGEQLLLQDAQRRLLGLGFATQMAIAPYQSTAQVLARCQDGIILQPQDIPSALYSLPIAALDLPEPLLESLQGFGLKHVRELFALPRTQLSKRFGKEILDCLDKLVGARMHFTDALPYVPKYTVSQDFLDVIYDSEQLVWALELLLKSLCAQLASAQIGLRQLQISLTRTDKKTEKVIIHTSYQTHDLPTLTKLMCLKLENWNAGFGIEALKLDAKILERCRPTQSMLQPQNTKRATKHDDLMSLADSISNYFDGKELFRLLPIESHVPERSILRCPYSHQPNSLLENHQTNYPLKLLNPPEPITVGLTQSHAFPTRIHWRGQLFQLQKAIGPRRISGEWWGEAVDLERDYYQVETNDGTRLWIFCDKTWYLHGLFA